MKFIISLLALVCSISTFGQSDKSPLLQFGGYYRTECYIEKGDDEGSQDYFRFYASGKVINVGTDCQGTDSELNKWFNVTAEQAGIGDYQLKGRRLRFSIKSKTGLVKYKERLKKNGIIKLQWKSQINGNRGHNKYTFVPVAGLT